MTSSSVFHQLIEQLSTKPELIGKAEPVGVSAA